MVCVVLDLCIDELLRSHEQAPAARADGSPVHALPTPPEAGEELALPSGSAAASSAPALSSASGSSGSYDSAGGSDGEADSEGTVRIDLQLPRRSLLVQFSCNLCGGRSERLVNPVAWNKGMVSAVGHAALQAVAACCTAVAGRGGGCWAGACPAPQPRPHPGLWPLALLLVVAVGVAMLRSRLAPTALPLLPLPLVCSALSSPPQLPCRCPPTAAQVIAQCQHCQAWHKLADAANLVEEIRYADLEDE